MNEEKKAFSTIDEYIALQSAEIRPQLEALRTAIREGAPEAIERISYQMPTFYLNGNLVHFAAYNSHIGFYPAPEGIEHFEKDLSPYKTSKGAVQFPLDRPLPLELVKKIVRYRRESNLMKQAKK